MEKQFYQNLLEFDFSEPTALCTVMDWKGSVPRKDYPMMLVRQSGIIIGTIGGGTMEKEVIDRAIVSLQNKQSSLDSFDFTNDDLTKDGGLCGGTVKVAVESYTPAIQSFWAGLTETEIGRTWLTTYHFDTNEISRQNLYSPIQIDGINIDSLIKGKKNKTIISKDTIHLFRHVAPNPVLHIFGGGHVGKSVADLAHFIDMDITIHDDRESFAGMDRFPYALSHSYEPIDTMMKNINLRSSDLALVASRGHHHDLALIRWLLKSTTGWIGLVSSHRKWKILSEGLSAEGFTQKDIDRVQAPVGMNIKAQTVPEIAVSIIGGVIDYLRNTKKV